MCYIINAMKSFLGLRAISASKSIKYYVLNKKKQTEQEEAEEEILYKTIWTVAMSVTWFFFLIKFFQKSC